MPLSTPKSFLLIPRIWIRHTAHGSYLRTLGLGQLGIGRYYWLEPGKKILRPRSSKSRHKAKPSAGCFLRSEVAKFSANLRSAMAFLYAKTSVHLSVCIIALVNMHTYSLQSSGQTSSLFFYWGDTDGRQDQRCKIFKRLRSWCTV